MIATLLCALLAAGASAQDAKLLDLSTEQQKTLYALGLSMARDLEVFRLQPGELDAVLAGLRDAGAGKRPKVELAAYREKLYGLLKARRDAPYQDFLAKAAAEPGFERLPSGVLFRSTQPGAGAAPGADDTVRVHYRGSLVDGAVFDSSYERGQPSQFPLRGLIRCWQEGLPKLRAGGKARLICPAALAYGERGSPPVIGPGAPLIFDIELLEIVKQ